MEDLKQKIAKANEEAVKRINEANPVLMDIAPAGKVIPGLEGKMILHAGPPVTWERVSGAQRGSLIGAVLFEGWAPDAEKAEEMLKQGEIVFSPNHHHDAVGPMAGTISPSMPVWMVKNETYGNLAFCRQVERFQQFGDYSPAALQGLRLWRDLWAPAIGAGLKQTGGLPLKPIIAKSLQMGDELHNRPVAASSLFANQMACSMVEADVPRESLIGTLKYLTNHELIFLALAMAAAKAAADPARNIPYSTCVVAMCRNGTDFGIRVSGLGDEWFTAPAAKVEGLYLPGYTEADAGLDMGDSAITETVGWGGFVLVGATGILALVGGTPEEAMNLSKEMRLITIAESPNYRMPILGFKGVPVGIDIRKVVQTGILPIIDTAIAHRHPGHAIIGAGLLRAPGEAFEKALKSFAKKYGIGPARD